MSQSFDNEVRRVHSDLGISCDYEFRTGLVPQSTPMDLVSIGLDIYGREQQLRRGAAAAWVRLRDAAQSDSIGIRVVSAFRSFEYQINLVKRCLARDEGIDEILTRIAAPGYSEHQSGCALDLTTEELDVLEVTFEESVAFDWLQQHADRFEFALSYPRDNPYGVIYEPWHWCFRG